MKFSNKFLWLCRFNSFENIIIFENYLPAAVDELLRVWGLISEVIHFEFER